MDINQEIISLVEISIGINQLCYWYEEHQFY